VIVANVDDKNPDFDESKASGEEALEGFAELAENLAGQLDSLEVQKEEVEPQPEGLGGHTESPAEPADMLGDQTENLAELAEMLGEQTELPTEPADVLGEQPEKLDELAEMLGGQAEMPAEILEEQAGMPAEPTETLGEEAENLEGQEEPPPGKRPFYLEVTVAAGLAAVILVLGCVGVLYLPTAIYLIGLGLIPCGLWMGRQTNTVYTVFLGGVLAALLTAVFCLFLELRQYNFDVKAQGVKQRVSVAQPAGEGLAAAQDGGA
jgi:hypothetical protein